MSKLADIGFMVAQFGLLCLAAGLLCSAAPLISPFVIVAGAVAVLGMTGWMLGIWVDVVREWRR